MLDTATSTALNGGVEAKVADGSFDGGLAVALLFLSALIVASNCLTILAICTTKVLKTLQNMFIVALAAADIAVGVGLLALLVQRHFRPPRRWIECQYSVAILYSSITLSLSIMVSVALDRYVYIVRPFFYRRHLSAQRIKACLLVQWLLATAHGFMAAYLPRKETVENCNPMAAFQITFVKYVFPAVFCTACAGIFILYGLIARTAKRHWDRRARRLRNVTQMAASSSRAAEQGGKKDLLGQAVQVPTESFDVGLAQVNKGVPVSTNADNCPGLTSQEAPNNMSSALHDEKASMHEDIKCQLAQTGKTFIDVKSKMTNSDVGVLTDFDREISISRRELADVDSSKLKKEDASALTGDDFRLMYDVDLDGAFTDRADKIEIFFEKNEKLASKSGTERRFHNPSGTFVQVVLDAKKHTGQTPRSISPSASRYSCPSNDRKDQVTSRLPAVTIDTSKQNRYGQSKTSVSMRSLRWLRLTAIVFGLFTLCWSPTMVAIVVSWKHPVPKELSSVFAMLGLANSAVNFFVYALHTKHFRRAIFRRITCSCRD